MSELYERTARMEQSLSDLHKKLDDFKPVVEAVNNHNVEIAKIQESRKNERSVIGAMFALIIAWISGK